MMKDVDKRFMARALQLARNGEGNASPNPMVGAVIVHDGKIIGEGWHRRCGEGHAEVNAVASVRDCSLLSESTIYVTLEPCSHYGKTPPCARLLIDCGIPRVVVGSLDPFDKVSGRGVAMLRDAGVDVTVGVLEEECRCLNHKFITAHTQHRPYVTLKWAQSADGYLDFKRMPGELSAKISTPVTSVLVNRERSLHDAIMVGSGTVLGDEPGLTLRGWGVGHDPVPVILDREGRIPVDNRLLQNQRVIYFSTTCRKGIAAEKVAVDPHDLGRVLAELYARGITSVLVEGGATLLRSFIDTSLWDAVRVEVSPREFGEQGRVKAPMLPDGTFQLNGDTIIRKTKHTLNVI